MAIRVIIGAEPRIMGELARALPSPEFAVEAKLDASKVIFEACRDLRPQVLLLQIGLALRDHFDCVQDVMAYAPTPVLMVAGPGEDKTLAFEALASGALDAVEFPGADRSELAHRVRLLAGMRVIQHVRARHRGMRRDRQAAPISNRVVAIAASLGGPRALAQLLHELKPPLSAPILICQHISDGFTGGLANWLSVESQLPVHEAVDGEPLLPGMIVIAPSHLHLEVADGALRLSDTPPVGGFKPSCTALLRSVARWYGRRGIGVVLTGMGSDGAEGLSEMRRRGAHTLAQDESSCVVFGMPKAAWDLGAVERMLPLEQIPQALRRLLDEEP